MPRKCPTTENCLVPNGNRAEFRPSYHSDPKSAGQVMDLRILPEAKYLCLDYTFKNQGDNHKASIQNH